MTRPYLIGLSGPPRSGKDTLATAIQLELTNRFEIGSQIIALSMPMRHTVYAMLGRVYEQTHYEENKDVPNDALGGKTIRQAMIALSEQHVKPVYGDGFWGRALIGHIRSPYPWVVIVSDMGFQAEVDVFVEEFGSDNCLWPWLRRPGHSFAHDSRRYVGESDRVVRLDNPGIDGDLFFRAAAERVVDAAVEMCHWNFS